METNKKYFALSAVTALAVVGLSIGAISFAQTTVPVTCSMASSSVNVNQVNILTATGGNGTYSWSGPNLNVTNSAGSKFAVSYPTAGTYPITVSSAGSSAVCNVSVVGTVSTGNLYCSPAAQNLTVGQTATVSASGGNGTYTWSAPDLNITNPNGSGFSANYASTGLKTLTVTSGGLTATCAVNVLAGSVVITPTTPSTPALPSTGGGYGQQ
ncbi:MAG: hypothetical protein P4L81_05375 [Candidatus Pacebacteria bacterium]|nr:hypothetical protein [Candidatus Paceibacterota bacterium]